MMSAHCHCLGIVNTGSLLEYLLCQHECFKGQLMQSGLPLVVERVGLIMLIETVPQFTQVILQQSIL